MEEGENNLKSSQTMFNKIVKFISIIIVFFLTTTVLVISKGSTLFLVSQLHYPSYPQEQATCSQHNTSCEKYGYKEQVDDSTSAWLWCLLVALLFPDILTILKSGFIVTTQQVHKPSIKHVMVPLIFQTFHSIGICILFFIAMPGMSSLKMGLVIWSVCIIPAFFKACSDRNAGSRARSVVYKGLDVLSLVVQITSIAVWTVDSGDHSQIWSVATGLFFTSFGWWEAYLPYDNALVLPPFFEFLRDVRDQTLHRNRQHLSNLLVSSWKIVISFTFFIILTASLKPVPSIGDLFSTVKFRYKETSVTFITPSTPPSIHINESYLECTRAATPFYTTPDPGDCSAFWVRICLDKSPSLAYVLCPENTRYFSNSSSLNCYNENTCCMAEDLVECNGRVNYESCSNPDSLSQFPFPDKPEVFSNWEITLEEDTQSFLPGMVLLVQILSTYFAYKLSYFAFETRIEISSFAIPMTFAPLLTVVSILTLCNKFSEDTCFFDSIFPAGLFFKCSDHENFWDFIAENWIFFLSFLSQLWITSHIWTKRAQKLAKEELIFDTPFYDSLLIEQSLLLNRRMDDEKEDTDNMLMNKFITKSKIIGCATMWHESKEEMTALLMSVLKMDKDSKKRSQNDEDVYDWEMHIFFDNAFDASGKNVNKYVTCLLELMKEKGIALESVMETPYGGQIIWRLPGLTSIVCHLKDKNKIKIKKRWSQCMYIMFFLGQEFLDILETGNVKISVDQANQSFLKNTYLLALDGDVTFEPDSILKLVDLMKKDDKVGATCGRVHPTGSGLIAMYQKFEYAVGHWLQKTTEQVLGNVLCSPGCFSLFRLESLLVNKESHHSPLPPALAAYNTDSTQPLHCIQYDQGEDRWLCTLLIERGWKVEYCAVSDSYTACPETFREFYNQRRRWTPSTVANLLEILKSWKILVKQGNVTIFHVIYQLLMLAGSAIGPGSIFILLVGGLQMTLEISYWASFICNLLPVTIFILICLFGKPSHQISCAKVLSLIYGLCMIAVFFALVFSIFGSCPWSPSTVSVELTIAAFLLVGILHPAEMHYLLYGLVYYLTIPCMYMLLPIFCVFNLDDVSWGTRESSISAGVHHSSVYDTLIDIFNPKQEIKQFEDALVKEIKDLKDEIIPAVVKELSDIKEALIDKPNKQKTAPSSEDSTDGGNNTPSWIESIGHREEGLINVSEHELWKKITSNLKPVKDTEEQKKEIKEGLKSLKSEVFLLFLFLNSAWALGIFLMQLSSLDSSAFTFDWVLCENTDPVLAMPLNETMVIPDTTYVPLDPINFVFIVFFLIVLFIQFLGMLFHRIKTVGHIIATTNIFYTGRAVDILDHLHTDDISMLDGRPSIGITNPMVIDEERM